MKEKIPELGDFLTHNKRSSTKVHLDKLLI
jgi:hypothetical protein